MKSAKKILAIATAAAMLGITAVPAFAASGITKDETVYVVTEADGSVSDITVSDHLKNDSGADKIHDMTDLSDIENVKGDETFEKGEGDSIVWDAGGNDIFYEGTIDQGLPVKLGISYFLNGEEVQGSDMEGVSGDVKIVIDYRNTATDEKGTTMPFIAMSGFIAEDDCFTDIDVDQGKVIDDGDKQVVVAMAAPGLNDALNIDSDLVDLDLKDTVTITGTAKDFSVQDIMTIVTNSIFDEVDSDDFGDLDYDDKISQLDKGAKQLMEGSDKLYQGIDTLYQNMPTLEKGVDALKDGADQLDQGTDSAKDGSQKLAGGIAQLASALHNMDETMKQMYQALAGMENGTSSVINNLESMKGQMSQGAKDMRDGADQMEPAVEGLNEGLPQVYSYLDKIEGVIKQNESVIRKGLKAKGMSDAEINALINGATTAKNATGQMASAAKAMEAAPAGLDKAADGMDKAAAGLGDYDPSKGAKQETIIGGLTVIDNGLETMKEKVGQYSGTGDLSALDQLKAGADQLAQGEIQLAGGAKQLADGMQKLQDKSGKLNGGVSKLDSGSLKLSQGMSKLYKEGIRKIVDLYNDDLKGTMNDLEDVIDAGQSYGTFTELPEGMEGSVKFIYKTTIY